MTFATGLSALRANQTALSVTGNNIANATTPGFRRQEVRFVENPQVDFDSFSIGTGVSIGEIRQAGDVVLESAIRNGISGSSQLASKLQTAQNIEHLFLPGTGTIQERTEDLFLKLERLSALPTEATLRSAVVASADSLAKEVSRVSNALEAMSTDSLSAIEDTIRSIDAKASEVADLNLQIWNIENTGRDAFALRNERDLRLTELAEFVDVERRVAADGTETYVMAGGMFDVGAGVSDLEIRVNEAGELEIWKEGCDKPLTGVGGKLGGLVSTTSEPGGVGDVQAKLAEFVSAITYFLDASHATGVGIGGAFKSITSGRPVGDSAAALSEQQTIVPMEAGSLYVSVNDVETGLSTLTSIEIDPAVDTLETFSTKLNGIDHVTATVDGAGKIAIVASPGFTFDFTGNVQTHPDTSALSDQLDVEVFGRYSGDSNEQYQLNFLGAGTIGVTEGLRLEVVDENGLTVGTFDVGRDYEPNSRLALANGVSFSLAPGNVVDTDSFSIDLIARPDEVGVLAALGINTLFVGNSAGTLEVNSLLSDNPSLLATTTNGDPSDTRNLHRMIDARDALVMRDGTITMEQFLADMTAAAGQEVSELELDLHAQEEQQNILQSQLDLTTGVDVNEELAKMLQYQNSYQAAARYITVVDDMLQELFAIVR